MLTTEERGPTIVSEAIQDDELAERKSLFQRTYVNAVFCCDWANRTESGKYNLIGVFDRLFLREIPGRTPAFFLYLRLAGSLPKSLQVIIFGPSGQRLGNMTAEAETPPTNSGEPTFVQVLSRMRMQVDSVGVHRLDVFADDELVGRAPLIIELQETDVDDDPALSGIEEPYQE